MTEPIGPPPPTRRARATNKIINLAGLGAKKTGTAGSHEFPSFRFSPESEEMQEVITSSSSTGVLLNKAGLHGEIDLVPGNGTTSDSLRQAESVPSSPRSTGSPGEVSPLKEYLRKNWAKQKWDKKSLSLDLDSRGRKIITAIEDKRKSIVSHFIQEETGLIMPGPGIPEHTGEVVGSESEAANRVFTFDSSTQQVSSHIQAGGSTDNSSTNSTTTEDYEEIGIDYLANLEEGGFFDPLEGSSVLDHVDLGNYFSWSKAPESLLDTREGLQTPEYDRRPSSDSQAGDEKRHQPDDSGGGGPQFSSIFTNMFTSFTMHPWTKYLMVCIGAGLFIPMNTVLLSVFWFINGILVSAIVLQSLTQSPEEASRVRQNFYRSFVGNKEESPISVGVNLETATPTDLVVFQKKTQKSQGWMLELETYLPKQSFRMANPVFLRLEGPNLCISYPSRRARVPKRRYWNDPPFTTDIRFVRHSVFNISGAEIFIAPSGLAKNRVWNKKYPIGITLPKFCFISNVTPTESLSEARTTSNSPLAPTKSTLDEAGTESITAVKRVVRGDKEMTREDFGGKTFYLYSRTSREKDDWFRRFVTATKHNAREPGPGQAEINLAGPTPDAKANARYMEYMSLLIPNLYESIKAANEEKSKRNGKDKNAKDKDKTETKPAVTTGNSPDESPSPAGPSSRADSPYTEFVDIERMSTVPQSPTYLNALLGRMFFDFLQSEFWKGKVMDLIQKKLNFLKKPAFLEYLLCKELDFGNTIPIIHRASVPVIDSQGLWIDIDITYDGTFCVTLETKVNLMKMRKSPSNEDQTAPAEPDPNAEEADDDEVLEGGGNEGRVGNMYDSDADDSGESSEEEGGPEAGEEDETPENPVPSTDGEPPAPPPTATASSMSIHLNDGRGGKFLRMVEKMANSNFVSELKFVKKAVAGVANIPLILTVEVQALSGTVALNIPPPPTNRLWFGFRTKPNLKLIARPKFGDRTFNITPVTDWITAKIEHEFSRILVLPNMDDLSIPLLDFKLPS